MGVEEGQVHHLGTLDGDESHYLPTIQPYRCGLLGRDHELL